MANFFGGSPWTQPVPDNIPVASTKVSLRLKLLVDRNANRVLFAEADKDFVDFLFWIFSLPIGTVVRLLTKDSMVGCLGKLYESIERLNETYMLPNQSKDSVLNPRVQIQTDVAFLLPGVESSSTKRNLYGCSYRGSNCESYVTDDASAVCPNCRNRMKRGLTYVGPPGSTSTGANAFGSAGASGSTSAFGSGSNSAFGSTTAFASRSTSTGANLFGLPESTPTFVSSSTSAFGSSWSTSAFESTPIFFSSSTSAFGSSWSTSAFGSTSTGATVSTSTDGRGFVKGEVTYMVMDDLAVSPMSTISGITILNKFSVKDVGALEEKEVKLGINEGVKILRESMQSTTVLTSVFLEEKGEPCLVRNG